MECARELGRDRAMTYADKCVRERVCRACVCVRVRVRVRVIPVYHSGHSFRLCCFFLRRQKEAVRDRERRVSERSFLGG